VSITLPVADVKRLQQKASTKLDGLSWGETRQMDAGMGRRITITAMPARHSRDPAIAKISALATDIGSSSRDGAWKRNDVLDR